MRWQHPTRGLLFRDAFLGLIEQRGFTTRLTDTVLALGVVAEGVEDAAPLEALREMGCEWVQGYHFTKPLPADALVRWQRAFSLSS